MCGASGGITSLASILDSLPEEERVLFERIYDCVESTGETRPPESMKPWLIEHFGSVDRVVRQRIVRVFNRFTFEEAIFNGLRSSRPIRRRPERDSLEAGEDPLAEPLVTTPEDTFGRIEGRYCITAGNVAKYDGLHGVIIFNEPDPLRFTQEHVADYIDTACRWGNRAHALDPEARYPFFMWNCGERAGASLVHGHAQVMLARRRHYSKVERLRCAALAYESRHSASYWDDLFGVHRALGLGFVHEGVRVMAHLTPIKEKEVVVTAPELNRSLEEAVYRVLACFRDGMGVTSFNFALYLPPIADTDEDWRGFPAMARMVDRGKYSEVSSDFGAMELYASSVVSSDPFEVAGVLRNEMAQSA